MRREPSAWIAWIRTTCQAISAGSVTQIAGIVLGGLDSVLHA